MIKFIKNIIKSLGIITFISTIRSLIKKIKTFHRHRWEFGYENISYQNGNYHGRLNYTKEVKTIKRFCPQCGKKQIKYFNGKWRDLEMTKEEMREFKLNQIL